jgi:predicted solute-binding protein
MNTQINTNGIKRTAKHVTIMQNHKVKNEIAPSGSQAEKIEILLKEYFDNISLDETQEMIGQLISSYIVKEPFKSNDIEDKAYHMNLLCNLLLNLNNVMKDQD